jgi:transcription termination factor 2
MAVNSVGVRLCAPFQLYAYQLATVRWMQDVENGVHRTSYQKHRVNGLLLAMVMGLGKTLCTAARIMQTLPTQRRVQQQTLYVCPKTLLSTVAGEFRKFFGGQVNVLTLHREYLGAARWRTLASTDLTHYDVILTNYATVVSLHTRYLTSPWAARFCNTEWFRVVLDESHEIREHTTWRYKAVTALRSCRRLCLTGTPIHNRVKDLVNQMVFTGVCIPPGCPTGLRAIAHLQLTTNIRFVNHCDALDVVLPPKHRQLIMFHLTPREHTIYTFYLQRARKAADNSNDGNDGSDGSDGSDTDRRVRTCLMQVLQVCSAANLLTRDSKLHRKAVAADAPPLLLPRGDARVAEWVHARTGGAGWQSSKMLALLALVRTLLDPTHPSRKVVFFANLSSTLKLAMDMLHAKIPGYAKRSHLVYGGLSPKQRERAFGHFRQDDSAHGLFMTLKLGSVGLNLTEANTVVFIEPWYSHSALYQAESRVHRIGQRAPVFIYYLLGTKTVESRMYDIALDKKNLHEEVETMARLLGD